MRSFLVFFPVVLVATVASVAVPLAQTPAKPATAPRAAAPAAPRSPFKPTATVKDIMDDIMIPASENVFNSVSSTAGPNGQEDKVPTTDADWAEVRKNARMIVEAGNLKPDDALRSLFEKNDNCFAVACYPDSAADVDSLISDVLATFSLTIEGDARALLQTRLGADRALSRAEIEKLALYCLGRQTVTTDDVENVVGDAANLALERIAEAAAEGRLQPAVTDFGRALASGESGQSVIAVLQRYFLKLHKVRSDVDAGQRLDDALKYLRPPLFFKQRDAFARQVRNWQRPQLDQAIRRIADTAKAARLSPRLEDVYAERLLLALASMASAPLAASPRR